MKKKNESKRKHWVLEFFHKQEEKRPFNKLTIKLADMESFSVRVYILLINVFRNSNILNTCRDKIARKSAKHS